MFTKSVLSLFASALLECALVEFKNCQHGTTHNHSCFYPNTNQSAVKDDESDLVHYWLGLGCILENEDNIEGVQKERHRHQVHI